MAAVRSHTLSIGIVGLPNAGKSTLFNSITKNSIPAENFPFTTIDKNVGVVEIPDPTLDMLGKHYKAGKKVASAITFVDIAGLVKGAAKGEGLGNQFLSHIREVDLIMYVLRSFESEKIVHVYDRVDPMDDLEIVQSELILKDLEAVEKRLQTVQKGARGVISKEVKMELSLLERLGEILGQGKPAIELKADQDEEEILQNMWLLSSKPGMYLLNVREGTDDSGLAQFIKQFDEKFGENSTLTVDVKLVGELAEMEGEEKKEYLSLLSDEPRQVEDVIAAAYKRLNLMTFYTGNEKEVNAWTIEKGATAKEAAGVIHTDLGEGFITADIVNVEEMVNAGGWVAAKEKGIVKNHSKDYLIQDGDYMNVYAN